MEEFSEYAKKRMNSQTRLAVMKLGMVPDYIARFEQEIGERGEQVPRFGRDLKTARTLITKVYNSLIETAPDGTKEMIDKQVRSYVWYADLQRAAVPEDSMVISMENYWQMVGLVLSERCRYCTKEAGERKTCEARRLLRKYINEPEPTYAGECGYTYAGLHQMNGENTWKEL